ncbi:uncharacterized protein MONOS_17224 [Monocercomonoides exilis]|uniref:uncharacterized protein n=1 Tax=Monocercomonoides exilis TaxID=2049356 RepID=UPI003559DD8D|nr:hypothetical protein MONOS_17224 [Monocercomonoides exilis]
MCDQTNTVIKFLIDTTSRTRNITFCYKWLHPPFSTKFRVRKVCAVSSVQEEDIGRPLDFVLKNAERMRD